MNTSPLSPIHATTNHSLALTSAMERVFAVPNTKIKWDHGNPIGTALFLLAMAVRSIVICHLGEDRPVKACGHNQKRLHEPEVDCCHLGDRGRPVVCAGSKAERCDCDPCRRAKGPRKLSKATGSRPRAIAIWSSSITRWPRLTRRKPMN